MQGRRHGPQEMEKVKWRRSIIASKTISECFAGTRSPRAVKRIVVVVDDKFYLITSAPATWDKKWMQYDVDILRFGLLKNGTDLLDRPVSSTLWHELRHNNHGVQCFDITTVRSIRPERHKQALVINISPRSWRRSFYAVHNLPPTSTAFNAQSYRPVPPSAKVDITTNTRTYRKWPQDLHETDNFNCHHTCTLCSIKNVAVNLCQ